MEKDKADAVSYCGLYCAACPSVHRGSCFGCRSEDKTQRRRSKWACNIRKCCINKKNLEHCGYCTEYPCPTILKLINSHKDATRMHYRHEIPNNFEELNKMGIDKWAAEQEKLWKCPECGEPVVFWNYQCSVCGLSYDPQNENNKRGK
jgi:hypothetical protein